jgi:outer membrane cobalamin receptor
MKIRSKRTAAFLVGLALLGPDLLRAADAATDSSFDFFLQEAQVVSASRREQKKSDSPVAIDVITADEIAASGVHTLWDLLRFEVGMNVADSNSIEGNPAQVNVRGLPSEFSQNMQVLIDGRSVVSPSNSGVFWRNLPVELDDIERIEIVRGPNAALYGANAGQGVINIITKKAVTGKDSVNVRAETGQFGEQREVLAMTLGEGPVRGRVSISNNSNLSYPNATGATTADLNSVSRDQKASARLGMDPWKDAELEFFAGKADEAFSTPGAFGIVGGDYTDGYWMTQLHQKLGDDSFDVTLSGREDEIHYGFAAIQESVYDADAIYHLSLMDGKLRNAFGGSLRYGQAQSPFLFTGNVSGSDLAAGGAGPFDFHGASDTVDNHLRRLYWQGNASLTDWAEATLAASYESSDTGGQWPAYQAAVVLKPFANYSLRLSGAKSPTVPSLVNKSAWIDIPAGFFDILAEGNSQIQTTQISDYEATLSGSFFDRHLTAEVTGYQMEGEGLIYFNTLYSGFPTLVFGPNGPLGAANVVQYSNLLSAVARGTETVLTYKPTAGTSLTLNHTYEDVSTSSPDIQTAYTTPWNIVNLTGQSQLPWGINVAAQLNWTGQHWVYGASAGNHQFVEDQAVVNLRLGYKVSSDLEVYGVGENLDHAFRTEGADGTTQPQMYWAGLNYSFGNK